MTISFSGLGSGLPIDEWVEALVSVKEDQLTTKEEKQSSLESSSSALSTVKNSYSSLRTALESITDASFDILGGVFSQTKTSSSSDKISASSTSSSALQSLALTVSQLASSTTVQSALTEGETIGKKITEDSLFTDLASGLATEGSFSIYVDNKKYSIEIDGESTVGDILDEIHNKTGLDAEVVDGKVEISDPLGKNIVIGSNGDTSNFYTVMGLNKNIDGSYSSNHYITEFDLSDKILGEGSSFAQTVEASQFKIGNATFTIGENTTMQSLINDINASASAGVTASWDNVSGKMVLNSKQEGSFNVNIENISGNFTDLVGFTTSTYDAETGEVLSSDLKAGSQTLGDVARFTINGTELISPSNTVTSDVTGIAGLTISLNSLTDDNEVINLNVEQDSSSLESAIDTFISAFNTVLDQTDQVTGEDGLLRNESSLTSVRNNLRRSATESIYLADGSRVSLADIGITTGAVGTTVDDNTDKLVVDKEKFLQAFKEDPEKVKEILIGNSEANSSGVLGNLETITEDSLSSYGFFSTRETSLGKEITSIEETIAKEKENIEEYKTQLETKFQNMDLLISQLNTQYSQVTSILGSS